MWNLNNDLEIQRVVRLLIGRSFLFKLLVGNYGMIERLPQMFANFSGAFKNNN
jgi:hypothetical protein